MGPPPFPKSLILKDFFVSESRSVTAFRYIQVVHRVSDATLFIPCVRDDDLVAHLDDAFERFWYSVGIRSFPSPLQTF